MHGLKSAILAIFQKGLGWLCLVSAALKNTSLHLKKQKKVLGADEDWKAKLESAYSFMLKYSKMTVCQNFVYLGRSIRFLPISGINCANMTMVPIIYRDIKSLPRSVLHEISPYPT